MEERNALLSISRPAHHSTLKKSLSIAATGTSVIAVLPVPYLVLRSVFFLAMKKTEFTFQEMITTDNAIFWIFGPATALMATIAISPFNMYNAYNTVINIQINKDSLSKSKIAKFVAGFFLTFTGAVNGYNIQYALHDIFKQAPLAATVLQYPFVSIGVVFAGISDARVFLEYALKEIPRDYRYLKRSGKKALETFRNKFNFFNYDSIDNPLTKDEILSKIRYHLDDLVQIIMFLLPPDEVNALKPALDSDDSQSLLSQASRPFPLWRFIGSEVIGSICSGALAYFGNQNTYEYTYLGMTNFLSYLFSNSENLFFRIIASSTSAIAFFAGFSISFFLIRDLFFRDIFKMTSLDELKERLPKLLIPLIPAFSFGLLNIILTVLNENLSPLNKVLVSCAAIVGATVVTRYGIEGGLAQIQGQINTRRELARFTDSLMEKFSLLEKNELEDILAQFEQLKKPLALITDDKPLEDDSILLTHDPISINYNPHQ